MDVWKSYFDKLPCLSELSRVQQTRWFNNTEWDEEPRIETEET